MHAVWLKLINNKFPWQEIIYLTQAFRLSKQLNLAISFSWDLSTFMIAYFFIWNILYWQGGAEMYDELCTLWYFSTRNLQRHTTVNFGIWLVYHLVVAYGWWESAEISAFGEKSRFLLTPTGYADNKR